MRDSWGSLCVCFKVNSNLLEAARISLVGATNILKLQLIILHSYLVAKISRRRHFGLSLNSIVAPLKWRRKFSRWENRRPHSVWQPLFGTKKFIAVIVLCFEVVLFIERSAVLTFLFLNYQLNRDWNKNLLQWFVCSSREIVLKPPGWLSLFQELKSWLFKGERKTNKWWRLSLVGCFFSSLLVSSRLSFKLGLDYQHQRDWFYFVFIWLVLFNEREEKERAVKK